MKKKKVLYARLSLEDWEKQNEYSESIENQIDLIKAYCQKENIILSDTYIDDGYSGGNFDRPGFLRLKQDIEDGLIDTVITKDFSRLGRNFLELSHYILEFFPDHDIRYIAINDNYDSASDNSALDDFYIGINAIRNQKYIQDISRKVKSVKELKSKQKNFLSFTAPYGYKIIKKDGVRTLEIDEEAAKIVRRIFQSIADGKSRKQVAQELNQENVEPPILHLKMTQSSKVNYHFDWYPSGIFRIIRDIVYTGNLFYRKSIKENCLEKKRKLIRTSDRQIIFDTHPAIIDMELFEKANKTLKTMNSRRVYNYHSIFEDLIYCGECGNLMKISGRVRENGAFQYRFICNKTINRKSCDNRSIADSKLKEIVSYTLKKIITEFIQEENIIEQSVKKIHNQKDYEIKIDKLQKDIQVLDAQVSDLYLKKTNGQVTLVEFLKNKNDIEEKKNSMTEQLKALELGKKNVIQRDVILEKYRDFIDNDEFLENSVHDLIEKIFIYKDNTIKINFKIQKLDSEIIHLY